MNFGLLWMDALAVSILWVATTTAFTGRINRGWLRRLLLPIVVGVPLVVLGGFVAASAMLKTSGFEPNWFGYSVSLMIASVMGMLIVLMTGRQKKTGFSRNSAGWARGTLLFALLSTAAVGYVTLLNMDFAVRARCALQSVEINSVYLATLPAITSDAQNAAPLYERAFALLKDASDQEQAVHNPPTGNNIEFDPKEPATITFLNLQAGALALLRRAAALPACRFDQDLSDPRIDPTMISNLNDERNAANVLNLDAREELANGHTAPALADADAILRMSRHFGQRPMLVSNMVAVGIGELGDKTLEAVLPHIEDKSELATFQMPDPASIGRMCRQSLRGEERFGLSLYGNMPSDDMKSVNGQIRDPGLLSTDAAGPVGAFYRVFFLDSDAYVKLMEELQRLSAQPYCKVRPQLEAAYGSARKGGLLTSIVLPSLRRYGEIRAIAEAHDDCALVAVAMTRFRLDHGSLPAHLEELVPGYLDAIPVDPIDGKPLRLAVRGERCVIYGVGPDLVDHGGVENADRHEGDITFTLLTAKR